MGRDGGEPSTGPLDAALGQWDMNGFQQGSDMIKFAFTVVLEKFLWLQHGEWFGEGLDSPFASTGDLRGAADFSGKILSLRCLWASHWEVTPVWTA